MNAKIEDHGIRKAGKEESKEDCGEDRYECNVSWVCSCGFKGCGSFLKNHLFELHHNKRTHLGEGI